MTPPAARLPYLAPGRAGTIYRDWIDEGGEDFRDSIELATLHPFPGDKSVIDNQHQDATCGPAPSNIVKLARGAVETARRSIQQETLGHRDRKGDSLNGTRNILRAG